MSTLLQRVARSARVGALAITVAITALATLGLAAPAHAGRPCEDRPLETVDIERGLALAERTQRALEASGAQVVVLARAGQDLGKYGLRWSHLGFAYRDNSASRPVWRVVHKLNHCGTAEAQLYRQGLGEFFLDRPHRYEAAFVPLAAPVQARLLPLLADNGRAAALHEPRYSMVAYPWSTRYQQSNQWALETLALAVGGGEGRGDAQRWLRAQGWQPTTLHLGPLTRLGARMTAANVAFDDHPDAQRFADRIDTTTVDSIFAWLPRSGFGAAVALVR